jgi:hypothetical protein
MSKASKSTKSTAGAVATLPTFSMDNLVSYLEVVKAKIKEIKGNDGDDFKISKDLPGFGNIQNIEDPVKLIQAYHSVSARETGYNEAAKEMGLTKVPEFRLEGHLGTAWKQDIIRRYHLATKKEQLEKLEKVKKELEANLSQEDKLKAMTANIAEILEA